MAISNCKKVSSSILTQVRQNQEWVLVCLIWIFRWISSFCCKCEFRNAVVKFFARLSRLNCTALLLSSCSNFLRYRSSYIMPRFLSFSIFRLRLPFIHQEFSFMIYLLFNIFSLNGLSIGILNNFVLGFSVINSILCLTTCWRLPPSTISVVISRWIEFLFGALMWRQRSKMWFLYFSIILFNLWSCLYRIKLGFLLIFATIRSHFKIITIKELLVELLRLVICEIVRLLGALVSVLWSSFDGTVVTRWNVI